MILGTYRLLVEELNRQGGPNLAYRIVIEPLQPGFTLSVETNRIEAAAGGAFEIKVTAARREYEGPIALSTAGLADDFVMDDAVISEKKNEATLKVKLPGQVAAGQLLFPILVMMKRVAIHRLVFTAVNPEIGLAIAVEVELAQREPATDRLLENSSADVHSLPGNFTR